ncbi:hypothetical protein JKP88DRAFT_245260 [Tribonema minus]|uniref:Uncharacterized protein n=1 Tax=Tribonema minus TaxID=303371 RepID=A0A836CFL0_9STRA|nr:hypothetical protein JKP88DRAFT_245260 [Tribonema minus]
MRQQRSGGQRTVRHRLPRRQRRRRRWPGGRRQQRRAVVGRRQWPQRQWLQPQQRCELALWRRDTRAAPARRRRRERRNSCDAERNLKAARSSFAAPSPMAGGVSSGGRRWGRCDRRMPSPDGEGATSCQPHRPPSTR